MSNFINTIDALGDDVVFESIVNGTITEFNDDQITTIGAHAFFGCTNLESVCFPNATNVGEYAFYGCTTLENIYLPEAITIGSRSFEKCTSLIRVVLPRVTSLGGIAYGCDFAGCTSLKFVDLYMVADMPYAMFLNCSSLVALVIRTETVPPARNEQMFQGTPIASGTGYIYVPRDLVNSYATANYWSTYVAQYRPLEDYTVDGTTTGELREKTESLSLNVTELTFSDANTQTLTVTGVLGIYDATTWTTSDKTVARVKNGIITPVKDGTATITVTCGDYSATCAVTVNAGLEAPANILDNIDWNAGYISDNGSITAGGAADTYTTKFDISEYSDASIIVTLLDVTSNPTYSRICYYNESESIIGATQGTAGDGCVTITSTVPNNAVYAAISINKSGGLSGIEITCDNVLIGSVEYTS